MIELKHLTKHFKTPGGTVAALEDIDLTIPDGDIFGIIGMSGAGKSTLVRCINLLERPDQGTVTIDGRQMQTLTPAELRAARRDIAMIFQQFNLLMQRTCLKNVCFPLELAGRPRAEAETRARQLLELVGLPDKADAYPAQLSGGQKQRIAIARALATDPKVLLCDEATSALDPNTTHAILQLIQQINRELGITVVIITHQMSVVEEVCNHVAILDGGRVVEQGDVAEIFSNPRTDAARRLVFPAGAPRGDGELLPGRRLVRVAFNGTQTTDKPLVASLAIECNALVSIVAADTRVVHGQTLGSMLLALPEDEAAARRALDYIRAYPGLSFEEVQTV
ncbi:MAG: methionine ABC transporter ATP-binding protein [Gemmiger sp.]|mgnify:FL=1